jgi:hypothetical protein
VEDTRHDYALDSEGSAGPRTWRSSPGSWTSIRSRSAKAHAAIVRNSFFAVTSEPDGIEALRRPRPRGELDFTTCSAVDDAEVAGARCRPRAAGRLDVHAKGPQERETQGALQQEFLDPALDAGALREREVHDE